MSESTTIRALRAEDRDAWRVLWDGYLRFYREDLPEHITELTFRRLVQREDGMFGLVAVDSNDRPVGLANVLTHPSTWTENGYCYLEDLYVSPEARGTGAGRALIEAVIEAARERDITRVYWHTQQFNGRARSLYDVAGTLTSMVVYERSLD